MAVVKFLPYISAIQYDGTNSAEILGYFADYVPDGQPANEAFIVSEADGTVVFRQTVRDERTITITLDEGDWININPTGLDDIEVAQPFRVADGGDILIQYVQDEF